MSKTKLGRVQLLIMRVLWARGRVTAREITDELNQHERVAHSTVQTLLRKLEDKGSVGHDVEERTFIFYPLVKEGSVTKKATQELISRVFGGSAAELAAYLVQEEKIPKKELEALRSLIDEKTAGRRGKQ